MGGLPLLGALGRRSLGVSVGTIAKNAFALALILALWLATATGWLSPDRATRDQWERIEALKGKPGKLVYQSNFAAEAAGRRSKAGSWGRYNDATETVLIEKDGVTVNYEEISWIGAVFEFDAFEPSQFYRVTVDRVVEGEPGALIVRNRQADLTREAIPVGKGEFSLTFVAPPGWLDKVYVIFIPDGTDKPKGQLRINSLKIERLGD